MLWNPSFLSGWTWQKVGKGQCPLKNDRLRSSCVRQSQREPSPTARYCRPSSSSSSSRKRVPDCGSSWWKCLVVVVVRVKKSAWCCGWMERWMGTHLLASCPSWGTSSDGNTGTGSGGDDIWCLWSKAPGPARTAAVQTRGKFPLLKNHGRPTESSVVPFS